MLGTAAAIVLHDLWLAACGSASSERQRAAARRLARRLGELRGVYTKLGQLLALRAEALSAAARDELSVLADAAAPQHYRKITREMERALGPLRARFRWIDPVPLATASIAQVHRAQLVEGAIVAVKVRHPELTPQRIERDLAMLRRGLRLLGRRLGSADFESLLEACAVSLHAELDFEREATIAEAIARNLQADPRVIVPRVHWQASGRSVLTLDYVPSLRLDDRLALAERGIAPEECLDIVLDAYARQIFTHGLFHADPHPGNLRLVDERDPLAPAGEARPRILFVDFGLSQHLPAERLESLRQAARMLLKRDLSGLLQLLRASGIVRPGYEAQAQAALREALEAGAAEALTVGAERIQALKELAKRLVRRTDAFRLPADLWLYARTLAYLYGLARRIDPASDPMPRLLPHVLRFIGGS